MPAVPDFGNDGRFFALFRMIDLEPVSCVVGNRGNDLFDHDIRGVDHQMIAFFSAPFGVGKKLSCLGAGGVNLLHLFL